MKKNGVNKYYIKLFLLLYIIFLLPKKKLIKIEPNIKHEIYFNETIYKGQKILKSKLIND